MKISIILITLTWIQAYFVEGISMNRKRITLVEMVLVCMQFSFQIWTRIISLVQCHFKAIQNSDFQKVLARMT